jgi:hypothetical protein
MNRIVLGAVAALLLAAAGFFWWQGRAEMERGAPPPDLATKADAPIELPNADPHGRGAALPTAVKKLMSTDEKRFNRFDKNRDGTVNRNEMLSTRVKAFQKLDGNHDNLLSFEEWAVKTANRFKEIDRNGDGIIARDELKIYYSAQDAKKAQRAAAKSAACACGKPAPAAKGKPPEDDEED